MEIIIEEILQLVKKKMREQAAFNRTAFNESIDESINYFLERGKLCEEDNIKFIKSQLIDHWPYIYKRLGN